METIKPHIDYSSLTALPADYTEFVRHYAPAGAKVLAVSDAAELENLVYPAKSFDVVVVYNSLEKTKDVPAALVKLLHVLKAGGLLMVYSPNILGTNHVVRAYRRRDGKTFEGTKNKRQLFKIALRNIVWLLGRTLLHKPRFKYFSFEAAAPAPKVYLNPVDLRFMLESLGTKILAYQSVSHLEDAKRSERIASRFLADHMSVIRIVARKGARYERH